MRCATTAVVLGALADVDLFIDAFPNGLPDAGLANPDGVLDLANPDGVLDLADVVAFVEAFNAGCP